MRVVNKAEMKEIEEIAKQEYGFEERLIIENVGLRAAEEIHTHHLQQEHYEEIVFLIGKGNNGADGLATARHLTRYNMRIRAFLLFAQEELTSECQNQIRMAAAYGVKVTECRNNDQLQAYFDSAQERYFIVDAIFGTGIRFPLSDFLYHAIRVVNENSDHTVSLDLPSGVCSDTGQVQGNAIKAHTTLAIGVPKVGLYIHKGGAYAGNISFIDAGFPTSLLMTGKRQLLTSTFVAKTAKKRDPFAHKNTFGHVLVLGGSRGLTGALLLASNAALKVGTGLVTAITWEDNYAELVARVSTEIMTDYVPNDLSLVNKRLKFLEKYNSVVVGPGLGKSPRSREVLLLLLKHYHGPLVIDADAINVLSLEKDGQELLNRKAPTVFTPHMGEFSRFMNIPKEELQASPLESIKLFSDKTGCSILLKGPATYIHHPNEQVFIHYYPNPGMATGGSGDVLAGLIGGLFAQTRLENDLQNQTVLAESFYDKLRLATVVHSLAGQSAAEKLGERGMVASSIIEHLSEAFFALGNQNQSDYHYRITYGD